LRRIGELDLLLAHGELGDLNVFDHFRDKVVEAIEFAEDELGNLKGRGDAWSLRETQISEAWGQLSRRLALVRLHLASEVGVATEDFDLEREDLLDRLNAVADEMQRESRSCSRLAKIGSELERLFHVLTRRFRRQRRRRPHRVDPKTRESP